METYELITISDGDCSPSLLRDNVKIIRRACKTRSGEVVYYKLDGRRNLTSPIHLWGKHFTRGVYQRFKIEFKNGSVGASSLSKYLCTHPNFIRHTMVLKEIK